MLDKPTTAITPLNRGFDRTVRKGRLSLGLVVPIDRYADSAVPDMTRHLERVRQAERLGFAAVWLRDVPFNVPSFGDAGQLCDPFVYLGYIAAATSDIALGTASIVLPPRHPAHVAKAVASVDQLSGGRLILGVASGDRPEEYPAMDLPFQTRGKSFRQSVDYIRRMAEPAPVFDIAHGRVAGWIDMLPKPVAGRLPLLVTGGSRQAPDWIAAHGDGGITYPRPPQIQAQVIADWQARVAEAGAGAKPVMQPLYLDLAPDPDAPPRPIHLGLATGAHALADHLRDLQAAEVNHVALNLRFQHGDIEATLDRLAEILLPEFTE